MTPVIVLALVTAQAPSAGDAFLDKVPVYAMLRTRAECVGRALSTLPLDCATRQGVRAMLIRMKEYRRRAAPKLARLIAETDASDRLYLMEEQAAFAAAEGRLDDAVRTLDATRRERDARRDDEPGRIGAMLLLARVLVAKGDAARAETVTREALAAATATGQDRAEPAVLLADLLARRGDSAKAERLLATVPAIDTEPLARRLLRNVAEMRIASANGDAAAMFAAGKVGFDALFTEFARAQAGSGASIGALADGMKAFGDLIGQMSALAGRVGEPRAAPVDALMSIARMMEAFRPGGDGFFDASVVADTRRYAGMALARAGRVDEARAQCGLARGLAERGGRATHGDDGVQAHCDAEVAMAEGQPAQAAMIVARAITTPRAGVADPQTIDLAAVGAYAALAAQDPEAAERLSHKAAEWAVSQIDAAANVPATRRRYGDVFRLRLRAAWAAERR
ncbi:hypothetical protein [uncultured Sphingomonas sp.]|uniref:hypothetical protein n=1 Tax=uncultured Sphingomonas sp. TaxID=158754 RepID=UPI00259065FB|nr:hypothetical protein [uncultured Sphingomonas sp.]